MTQSQYDAGTGQTTNTLLPTARMRFGLQDERDAVNPTNTRFAGTTTWTSPAQQGEIIVHECYVLTLTSSAGYLSETKHDIAIIRLAQPVNNFAPIQISDVASSDTSAAVNNSNGPYATAAGWGRTLVPSTET